VTRMLTLRSQRFVLSWSVGLLVVLGCSRTRDFSDADWDKVKLGMSLDEVEKALGPGEKIQQSEYQNFPGHVQADTFRRWKSGDKKTSWAAFKDGKLVAKQQEKKGT
jgi:hypothetical protein